MKFFLNLVWSRRTSDDCINNLENVLPTSGWCERSEWLVCWVALAWSQWLGFQWGSTDRDSAELAEEMLQSKHLVLKNLKAIFCISIASAPRIHLLFAGLTMIPWLVAFAVRCYSGCPPCRSAKDRVDPCNTKCSINPQEAGNLKQLFCEVLAHIQNCFYSVLRKLKLSYNDYNESVLKITTFSCVDSNSSGFCLN